MNTSFIKKRLSYFEPSVLLGVFGFAVAFFSFVLISAFILPWALSESDIASKDDIFRLETTYSFPAQPKIQSERAAGNILPILKEIIVGDLEAEVHAFQFDVKLFQQNNGIVESEMLLTGDGFLDVFDIPLLHKSASAPLSSPLEAVISSQLALSLFGKTDVVGLKIKACCFAGEQRELTITGVFAPQNHISHINLELVVRRDDKDFIDDKEILHSWLNVNLSTYIKLKPNTYEKSAMALNGWLLDPSNPLCDALDKALKHSNNQCADLVAFSLVPITGILFENKEHTGYLNGAVLTVSRIEFLTLMLAASFVLLLAGVNSVFLLVAQIPKLSNEFLLKKLLGSHIRNDLFELYIHFFYQVVLATVLSALCLVVLCYFSPDSARRIGYVAEYFRLLTTTTILLIIFLLPLLLAIYPTLYFRGLVVADKLKKRLGHQTLVQAKSHYRLLIIQYTVCFVFAFCTSSMFYQLKHFEKLNIKTENIFRLDSLGVGGDLNELIEGLSLIQGIDGITSVSVPPGAEFYDSKSYKLLETPSIIADNRSLIVNYIRVEQNFQTLLGLESLLENGFNQPLQSLSTNRVRAFINLSAMHLFGFRTANEAIGKTLTSSSPSGQEIVLEIIDVIADDYYQSAYFPVKPTVFELHKDPQRFLLIKVNKSYEITIEKHIQQLYSNLSHFDLESLNLDLLLSNAYVSQYRLAKLMLVMCLTSLVIAGFTLFAYTKQEKVKTRTENRVARVYGASMTSLSKKHILWLIRPIAVALMFSVPISILLFDLWRRQFEQNPNVIDLLTSFLFTSLTILCFAFLVVIVSLRTMIKNQRARIYSKQTNNGSFDVSQNKRKQ